MDRTVFARNIFLLYNEIDKKSVTQKYKRKDCATAVKAKPRIA